MNLKLLLLLMNRMNLKSHLFLMLMIDLMIVLDQMYLNFHLNLKFQKLSFVHYFPQYHLIHCFRLNH
jgi:hypothetical protein